MAAVFARPLMGLVWPLELNLPALADALLGLACLGLLAALATARLWPRRHGPDMNTNANTNTNANVDASPALLAPAIAWAIVAALAGCGLLQLARAFSIGALDRATAAPALAALACWTAALAWRPSAARASPRTGPPSAGGPPNGSRPVEQNGTAPRSRADWGPSFQPATADTVIGRSRLHLESDLKRTEAQVREFAEADARKNEFLAMLGHELRNPLAPIRNALRIMKLHEGDDHPDLRWARDVVDHQLRQLGQLVDELQEMSRVAGGKVRLDKAPIDVATLVAYALETSRPVIDAHRHRLSVALPPKPVFIEADPGRMAQVLSNLLNNAAKYTEDGGQVRLAVAVERGEVVFRVRDNGVGIPPEMLPRVFDLYTQVGHSLDRSLGGLGLGLNLARNLTEMHGGTIEARSDGPGRGSEFIVRLPAAHPAPSTSSSKPRLDEAGAARPRTGVRTPIEQPARGPFNPRTPAAWAEADANGNGNGDGDANETTGASAADGSPADPSSPNGLARQRRALIVDDNATAARTMAMILRHEGYDVQIAFDGASALMTIRTFRPEAVLLDIGLPGMDGHEVARRIRSDPELNAGIVLLAALTGFAEDEARERSRAAGFDQHLVKPIDPDDVLALLASLEWADDQAGACARAGSGAG